jgi:hypothetical protein
MPHAKLGPSVIKDEFESIAPALPSQLFPGLAEPSSGPLMVRMTAHVSRSCCQKYSMTLS